MNVAEYVIARIAAEGVDTAFLVYGGAIADLVDALPGRMNYVVTQHEQAAGFAAEGYAKAGQRLGFALATSGPGAGNLVTPAQNCYYDSTPVIFVTGQVATKFLRPLSSALRQRGFQETPAAEIFRPITKYARTVKAAAEIGWTMDQALYHARAARPGPVLVDLPNDVQRETVDAGALQRYEIPPALGSLPGGFAERFLNDLVAAARPGILVGGGAYAARAEILAFAEKYELPVFRTWNALDVVTDDHPCFGGTVGTYGGAGRNFGVQNCDLLLVLGCRLSGRITGGVPESFARGAKMYVVDVDAGLLDPAYQPRRADVCVLADCGEFVRALA